MQLNDSPSPRNQNWFVILTIPYNESISKITEGPVVNQPYVKILIPILNWSCAQLALHSCIAQERF